MANNKPYDEGYDAYWDGVVVSDRPPRNVVLGKRGGEPLGNTITTRARAIHTRYVDDIMIFAALVILENHGFAVNPNKNYHGPFREVVPHQGVM